MLSTATHNRVLGGVSIASFYSSAMGGPVIPNAFNPDKGSQPGTEVSWLSLFTEGAGSKPALFRGRVGNYGLTKGDADLVAGRVLGVARNMWEQGLINPFNQLQSSQASAVQSSSKALSGIFGTPSGSPLSLSTLIRSDFMGLQNDTDTESIELPGVQLLSLHLTIQNDLVELEQRSRNRQIEHLLLGTKAPASFKIPRHLGGELEDVLELIAGRIAQFTAAGLPLNNAHVYLGFAYDELAEGDYGKTLMQARNAYNQLIL